MFGLLAVTAAPAPAQPGWELAATAGALRADEDLVTARQAQWVAVFGGRLARRVAPQAALELEAWRGEVSVLGELTFPPDPPVDSLEVDRTIWGAGGHLVVTPFADRRLALQPRFRFGVEALRVDDDADRSVAFVGGAGLGAGGSGWLVDAELRNHFLSVEERGGDSDRDASLWEARVAVGYAWGGAGR